LCEYLCERQALQKAGKLTASFHKSEKNVSNGFVSTPARENGPNAGKILGSNTPVHAK